MRAILQTKIDNVPVEIEILTVGPASFDDIENLKNHLSIESVRRIKDKEISDQSKNPVEMVGNLVDSVSNIPEGKNWWESKTIWVNVVAIIAGITGYFGLPVDIEPEMAMTIFPSALAVINLILRGTTKTKINPVKKKK
jgi:hypothetical protein